MVMTIEEPTTTDSNATIELALKQLRGRSGNYTELEAYYDGRQPLTYATEKYRDTFGRMVSKYTENMCPAVVDAFADRLLITGFTAEGEGDGADAWALWRANRMDQRAGEVHKEAVKEGDAFVIVWPNSEGEVRITPQLAGSMTVHYNEDEKIDWAAKWWLLDDKRGRLNLYFEDRIERWITKSKVETGSGIAQKASGFVALDEEPIVQNPHGRVPVFHFANNADIGSFGRSDLKDVLPVQDALNKSVADLLVSMEFASYAQRWATGLQVELDELGKPKAFSPGVDRLWTTASEDAKFGEFSEADLSQILAVRAGFKTAVADVTGVPTHYLQMNPTTWPSGESLKTAEARFVAKVRDRQIAFGNVWEDVIMFALEMAGRTSAEQLAAVWQDASPRSDREMAEVGVLKQMLGVPNQQLQREMGYNETEIETMAQESETQTAAADERRARLFDTGKTEAA